MRVGKFLLMNPVIFSENSAAIFCLLKFVPLKVEHFGYYDRFEYTGISTLFDDIPQGLRVPNYTLTLIHNDEGMKLEVKRDD